MSVSKKMNRILLPATISLIAAWSTGHSQDELQVVPDAAHEIEQIEIQIGEMTFIADLLWEKAPRTTGKRRTCSTFGSPMCSMETNFAS